MIQKERTADLFQKYFDKTATAEEREELMLLITEVISDHELLNLMEAAYHSNISQQNPFKPGKREEMLQQIQACIARE